MSGKALPKLLNVLVVATLLTTLSPVALLAGASAIPSSPTSALPPAAPAVPTINLGSDLPPATISDVINAGTGNRGDAVQIPWSDGPEGVGAWTDDTNNQLQMERDAMRATVAKTVKNNADFDLPILDFLAKYPQLRQQVAAYTHLPSLASASYYVSPEELHLIYARISAMSAAHSAPGIWIRHGELAPNAVIGPLATAPTLLIDDDGSPNNPNAPADPYTSFGIPFTDQAQLVRDSLNASAISYDVFVRPWQGDIPDFATLTTYDHVIYVAGQNFVSWGTVPDMRIRAYLQAEGDVWAVGQFSIYGIAGIVNATNSTVGTILANFPVELDLLGNYFGVASWESDGTANPMNGVASGFLNGQSYGMTRDLREDLGTFTRFLDYSTNINWTASARPLTTGDALNRDNTSVTNVVNNIRNAPSGQGTAIMSNFEYNYFTNTSDRDGFTQRVLTNLTVSTGLVYDANTDVAITNVDIQPSIAGYTGTGFWFLTDGSNYLNVGHAVIAGQRAQVNVTVENFRNAAFTIDPKITMQGDGTYNPASRVENSTILGNTVVPARSKVNVSLVWYPHRMWPQELAILLFSQLAPDAVTDDNNWPFTEYTIVLGFYDGAETNALDSSASGFSRVTTDPTGAFSGSNYWFTGSGAGLNNTLTLPWIDTRYLNGSGPGGRSIYYIDDFLYLGFYYRGDVVAPDTFGAECRNSTGMVFTPAYTLTGDTRNTTGVLQWNAVYFGWNLGGGLQLGTFGGPVPEYPGDHFIQCRFFYITTGAGSLGYRLDDIAWYALQEKPAPVDFLANPVNSIVAPSPSYQVWQGSTLVRSGIATGTIDINETETVTLHAGAEQPQGDSFTYNWSKSPANASFISVPAGGGPVWSLSQTINITTDLNTYENLQNAGGSNIFSVSLSTRTEMLINNATSWTIRVRDAVPQWGHSSFNFSINEDSQAWFTTGGVDPWFTDAQGDPITITGVSPSAGGFPTVTLTQNASNASVGLRASSPDWNGLTNVTVNGCDNKGSCLTQLIWVTINPINDAPRFDAILVAGLNSTARGPQDQSMGFQFAFWDVDDAASTLTITVAGNHASSWTQTIYPTGDPSRSIYNLSIGAFEANNSVVGPNYFNITFCDSGGLCVTASVRATIDNVNDRPRITTAASTRYATQGQRFQLQIDAYDPDDQIPNAIPTSLVWSDDTNFFEVTQTGMIDFTPTNDMVGSGWPITVRVSDGQYSVPLTFTLVINNTNDPPVLPATGPDIVVNQGQQFVSTDIVATDIDLALYDQGVSESLSYSDDSPLFAVETVRSDKPSGEPQYLARINFQPTNDQVGTWFANITVTDAAGAQSVMRLRIVVNNLNDNPVGVKINITDQNGVVKAVTIPNQKIPYTEGDSITMQVNADDPDLRPRANDPTTKVDPNERITCSMSVTFTGSLDVAQSDTVKPTIDPDTCLSEFSPGNNEVGTFTIVVTVRDQAQASTSFRFQLEVKNVNQGPKGRIVAPLDSFSLKDTDTLQLSAVATDVDTPESLLSFTWRVEIVGGQVYNANGKTAQVAISNGDAGDKQVKVTLTVTDNLDAAVPLTDLVNATGTIKGKPASPGFESGAVIAGLIGAAGVAALVGAQRRRREE